LFGAIQWQNDRWDINVEGQYSERDQTELRQDLQIQNAQEDIVNLISDPVTGLVDRVTLLDAEPRANTTDFQRLETTTGGG